MSIDSTRQTILNFLNAEHGDTSMMADEVTFTVMGTGQESHGPQGVLEMMNYLYRIAFEASVDTRLLLFGDSNAVLEGDFVGKHIGEFAGIPATGKEVRVPLCVVYELKNEQITAARVYFETPVLLGQLGVPMPE